MTLTLETARKWYAQDDPVHGFDHIVRVYGMAERLAQQEGADLEIVRLAALLHDVDGSHASADTQRDAHQLASADFARQVLEDTDLPEARIADVLHAIRAHRFRDESEQPQTLEAQILFDADKLDAIGAIGIARAIAYSVQAGQDYFVRPSARFLITGEKEPGEAHSAYHEFIFKLVRIKDRLYTPTARLIAEERHRFMVRFFERLNEEVDGVG